MDWITEQRHVRCDESGAEHRIDIALPLRFPQLESPPVVVALDGAWTHGTVVDACRIMSMQGEAPEAVVVGVSFERDRMSDYLADRARWYTPTPYVPPAVTGVKGLTEDETGRADVLRRFLGRQLLPVLEEDFGVGERWFFGHSFSALFGLGAAGYTAFLFAQCEGRDLWQTPLLLPTLLGRAVIAGGAAFAVIDVFMEVPDAAAMRWAFLGGIGAVAALTWMETVSHGSRHVQLAVHEMVKGHHARLFWIGVVEGLLVPAGLLIVDRATDASSPALAAIAAVLAVGGMFAAETAFIRAGQSVPLS